MKHKKTDRTMSPADAVAMTVRAEKKLPKLHRLTLAALRQWHKSLTGAAERLERYGAPGEMKRAKVLKLRFKTMVEQRVLEEAQAMVPENVSALSFAEVRFAAE